MYISEVEYVCPQPSAVLGSTGHDMQASCFVFSIVSLWFSWQREIQARQPLICGRNLIAGYSTPHMGPRVLPHSVSCSPPAAGGGFPSADGKGLTELHPDFMRTRSNRSRCGDVPTNLSCGEGATCLGQECRNTQCQLGRLHMTGWTRP